MRLYSPWIVWTAGLSAVVPCPIVAQPPRASLAGTYSGSEPEVGAELRLERNGRFEYYLSYGALDETAQGTWTADDGGIVLTSDPVKAPIFQYLGYEAGSGSTVTITLEAPQQLPLHLFSVFVLRHNGTVAEVPFEDGPLQLPLTGAEAPRKIAIAFSLYQVASQPYDMSPVVGEIHFRFVPNDLGKVPFDHHRLARDGDAFVLKRFDRELRFRKETPENSAENNSQG